MPLARILMGQAARRFEIRNEQINKNYRGDDAAQLQRIAHIDGTDALADRATHRREV